MLKNTFGEHSYKQIKNITKLLNASNTLTKEESEWAEKIIDRIGEKTVKKKLLQLYKKRDNAKSDLLEQIMNITDGEKIEKIRKILEGND